MENDLSDDELLIISLIGLSGKIKSTRLQKLSLLSKAIMEGKVPSTHNAFYFGAFSDEIEEDAGQLREEGFLKFDEVNGFTLSDDGKKAMEEFERSNPKLVEKMDKLIKAVSELNDKKLIALTYALFPQLTKNSLIKEKISKIPVVKISFSQLQELAETSGR